MTRPLKILAVDDSPSSLALLEAVARHLGHAVVTARDGLEAIAQYKASQPDLVFMDIVMPNMDGLAAVQQIRRLPSDKWVPIVLFSAMDSLKDVVKGLESGGDEYLIKPFNPELIGAKINSYARILELQDKNLEYGRELEMWRHDAEHQAELGQHVISRLVDAQGLRDPQLRWLNIPAQTFSGDLLCAARAPGDVLHLMLADATGHGLAAAISSLPLTQIFYGMTAKGFPLRAITEELNRKIRALMPADRFVAATLVCIDARNQTIEIWNGGNPAALLVGGDGDIRMRWPSRHPPLGILNEALFSGTAETVSYQEAGELVLCSDGVIEAEAPDGRQFGQVALERLLTAAPPGRRFDRLQLGLIGHLAGQEGHDDISCLFVQVPVVAPDLPARPLHRSAAAAPPPRVSEWRLELTWGSEELAYLDVVPTVMSMLGQLKALKPHQGSLFLVLSELFNNALDHGLLGLDSALKGQPNGFERYLQLREERLASLSSGRIEMSCHLYMDEERVTLDLTLSDSGPGFDYACLLARQSETDALALPHGRGIALVRSLCRELIYSGSGNRVLARLVL
jgi:CheY-like chemotaxis protein/anti-sigma regulatory factor (Ser/Thr protein kinase)